MNILDQIIEHKRKEVSDRKQAISVRKLEQGGFFLRPTVSLKEFVRHRDKSGIIAEFKRRSPSKGVINGSASPGRIAGDYIAAGASAVSVLTDREFFGGSNDDLSAVREHISSPVLRKDFTIDEYQIVEAKSIGADAILLIAAVLKPEVSKAFAALAHSLGLEVLMEVHNESELRDNLDIGADLIGVNNRNLKDFSVSTDVSKRLAPLIPDDIVRVSESGISTPEAIADLKTFGYEGFLVGENFMKHADPGMAAAQFMRKLKDIGE